MLDYFKRSEGIIKHFNSDISMHLIKMQEEIGEVAEAWISANGVGKKAGVFTIDDVFDEVCDVIIAGITTAQKIDLNAAARFREKWEKVERKLEIDAN